MGVRVKVSVTNHIGEVIAEAERKIDRVCEDTAERIARGAQERVRQVRGVAVEEMAIHTERTAEGGAVVAGYPWRQLEFGTVRTPAFPAFGPAAEVERPRFEHEIREAFKP